jgi:trimeric autotransporter adhesin
MTLTPNFAYKENVSGNALITGNNQQPQNWGPPALSFSNGINGLSDANEAKRKFQTGALSNSNFWIHGRHNFQFGADFTRQQYNIIGQSNPRGSFLFDGEATGNAFADFLLGIPATSTLAFGNADKYLRGSLYDGFITDDMRLSPSLTMNVGVRWEYQSPETELRGRLVNLDVAPGFSNAQPVEAYAPTGPLTGMKYPDSLLQPDKHGFQPRVGLSWRPFPASSMVVRLGYGVNYNTSVYNSIAGQMDQQAPISTSLSVPNPTFEPTLTTGFATLPGISNTLFGIDPRFPHRLRPELEGGDPARPAGRADPDDHLSGDQRNARRAGVQSEHLSDRRRESMSGVPFRICVHDFQRQFHSRGGTGPAAAEAAQRHYRERSLCLFEID